MARGSWKRSYRRGEGRRTRAQRRALRELWPRFGIRWEWNETVDFQAAFGRDGALTLDVGFGTGESLIAAASDRPDDLFVGIEVYRPGLGAALIEVEEHELQNVRIIRGDVFELLSYHVQPSTFDRLQIYFPEPWPDSPERRLVRPLLLDLLHSAVKPDGLLRVATDIQAYHEHVLAVASDHVCWRVESVEIDEQAIPDTEYARRAVQDGRAIHKSLIRHDAEV